MTKCANKSIAFWYKIKVKGGMCNMCKAVEDMIKEENERVERLVKHKVKKPSRRFVK